MPAPRQWGRQSPPRSRRAAGLMSLRPRSLLRLVQQYPTGNHLSRVSIGDLKLVGDGNERQKASCPTCSSSNPGPIRKHDLPILVEPGSAGVIFELNDTLRKNVVDAELGRLLLVLWNCHVEA